MEASRLEVRASLVAARDTQVLVRVHRTVQPGFANGYVIDVGREWFTLCYVADQIVFDGFQVVRFKDVSSVESPGPNATLVGRVLRLRQPVKPRDPGIDLGDIASVLRTASSAYPLITLHRDVADPDVCHIGAVERIEGGTVVLRLMSPDGAWEEEREPFRLQDITRVDFGGLYEEALSLVASSG